MEEGVKVTELEKIRKMLTEDELLCQLAEEAAELSQAALKLRRVLTGVNPTPVSYPTVSILIRIAGPIFMIGAEKLYTRMSKDGHYEF